MQSTSNQSEESPIISVRFRYHFISERVLVRYTRNDGSTFQQHCTEMESRLLIQNLLDKGFEVMMEGSEVLLSRPSQDGTESG
jgi:hypothetical protein